MASNDKNKNKKSSATSQKVASNRLELLISIVPRTKAEFFADLIQSFDVNMQMLVKAEGTASEEMLHLIGFADTKKAVIFSLIKEEKVQDALHSLERKFKTIKEGKGVACTVPLTSLIGVAVYGFLTNNERAAKEDKK